MTFRDNVLTPRQPCLRPIQLFELAGMDACPNRSPHPKWRASDESALLMGVPEHWKRDRLALLDNWLHDFIHAIHVHLLRLGEQLLSLLLATLAEEPHDPPQVVRLGYRSAREPSMDFGSLTGT